MTFPRRRALETRALHLLARAAVRLQPPLRAKRIVDTLGRVLRPLSGRDEARAHEVMLGLRGTCLTRALAIAARLPGASVVIEAGRRDAFWAHAWVEYGGEPLAGPFDGEIHELARLE